jgi:glucokinase
MPSILLDIGGTNLRIYRAEAGCVDLETVTAAAHKGDTGTLLSLVRNAARAGGVDGVAVSVAAPVGSASVSLTNSDLRIDLQQICDAAQARVGVICNDLGAAGYGLPYCGPDRLHTIAGPQPMREQEVSVVLGLGTGLGTATCIGSGAQRIVVPGEGGHATVAGRTGLHHSIIERTAARHHHVSNERLISFGIGLQEIFRSLDADEAADSPAPEEISAMAQRSGSVRCRQTMGVFFQLLGVLCGNLALGVRASTVYLVGDHLVELREELKMSDFGEYLCDKGRFRPFMEGVSVVLVDDPLLIPRGLLHVLNEHGWRRPLLGVYVIGQASWGGGAWGPWPPLRERRDGTS